MFPGFELFGKYISSYSILVLAGVFTAGPFAMSQYRKRTGDSYDMLIVLLFSAIGAVVGGTLLYGVTNVQYWYLLFEAESFERFAKLLYMIFGGSVFYGGLLGAMGVAAIVIRCRRLSFADVTDCAAPAAPLFHCWGRIGCFLAGCCYGVESDFGFVYEHASVEQANGVRRFPVQLAEALCLLIIFIVLWQLLKKGRLKGKLFAAYLLIYAPTRFVLEFFRGDDYRGFIFGLSTSQLISVAIAVCTAAYLLIKRFKGTKSK